jgi:hypothetical protein
MRFLMLAIAATALVGVTALAESAAPAGTRYVVGVSGMH